MTAKVSALAAGAPAAGEPTARSGAAPPPFRVPGQHFAAALTFLVLGAAALAWRAPALAAGAFPDPGIVAAVHLITLGWISTSIMGALYQFLPVALGASVRWIVLADLTFGVWTAGVAVFVTGLAGGWPILQLAGAAALGLAVILLAANLAATLTAAPRRGLTWWCVAGAAASLVGAWVLGALLAVNLSTGVLGTSRLGVLIVHLHVAAGGWVLLTMIGVADRLLPMFLLSHGAGNGAGKASAALVATGTAVLLLTEHVFPVGVLGFALALQAAGATLFLVQAHRHYRHRRRPRLDPGTRLVAGGLVLLGLATATGIAALLTGTRSGQLLTAYGVLLLPGGLGLFVAGHYYKIVPFLTWFHRFGPVASERDVPQVTELFDHRLAHTVGLLLAAGVFTMAVGAMLGHTVTCVVGATAFTAGTLMEATQMLGIARQRP